MSGVTKRFTDRLVLDRVSLSVKPGERAGIIGDNGSGKSTVLRLLAGAEQPDNGSVVVRAPGGVGYLAQTPGLPPEATVGDAIDLALGDLHVLERQLRELEAELAAGGDGAVLAAYAELTARFEARGGYEAGTRVDIALHGLGQAGLDRGRALGTLSGGERSRLALAATLASSPEVLLLDEPTNDLDDEAVAWLEDRLVRHRGTVVVVSHDRKFLDRVTDVIVEVDQDTRSVRRYGNGYAGYLTAKAAERARWEQEYAGWRADIARQEVLAGANAVRLAAIPRKAPAAFSGAGAFRARSRAHGAMSRIRSARERLHRLRTEPVPEPPEPLRFEVELTTGAEGTSAVAELSNVDVGGGRLRVGHLAIRPGERVLVTGPNGAGKSTLLDLLAGVVTPDSGTVRRAARTGYLRQETVAAGRMSALEAFAAGRGGLPEEYTEMFAGLGLFRPEDVCRPVDELSAGQRRRIDLARLVTEPAGLLLLDEPTNHLAPGLVHELEDALAGYAGAVVVVSHDRQLRERFAGTWRVLEVRDGLVSEK
ncbi:ribosomal protection-like ABC-F family protein [Longispora albida]|uniref:ribosomal protection-like ABC-F family protein n=1 Tax=Longispora albida TaxID=203523 RepID=UPI0003633175|nr:ABC-F family ATP-binding cassette domain-containing protein [Longispora albida]